MSYWKTSVLFREPERRFLTSKLEYSVLANGIMHGPIPMDKPLSISGLMPGNYTMKGAGKWGMIDVDLKVVEGEVLGIRLADSFSGWRKSRAFLLRAAIFIELVRNTPVASPPKAKKITSQFWVGYCDDPDEITDFFSEDAYYAKLQNLADKFDKGKIDNVEYEKQERQLDDCPITDFAKSQGEKFIDHDFIEWRWEPECKPLNEMFSGTSWIEMWANLVTERAYGLGVEKINCFVMVGLNESVSPPQKIKKPSDIRLSSGSLVFIGEVTHDDNPLC